jgi:hypothetical protein
MKYHGIRNVKMAFQIALIMLASALLFTPQNARAALKVVNLSGQIQTVSFKQAGAVVTKQIADGQSVVFLGGHGWLSIDVSKQTSNRATAKPRILSEFLGDASTTNRDSHIPATRSDVFVIWPGARLLFQYRRQVNGGGS